MAKNQFKEPQQAAPKASGSTGRRLGLPRLRFSRGGGNGGGPKRKGMFRVLESNLTFTLFLTAIGLVYIANAHYAEKQARLEAKLKNEIKELKSDYMTRNARLSVARQQTSILAEADSLGLRLPNQPPYILQDPHAAQ